MIVRLDDVLISSEAMKGKELQKFQKYVNWCVDAGVEVRPNILCQSIQQFPEAIDWIKEQLDNDVFLNLDLHGWDHGPYADRDTDQITAELDKAFEFMWNTFGVVPCRWVTPHGANSGHIQLAAKKFDLIVETTEDPVIDQKVADRMLRDEVAVEFFTDKVIMAHWWERGLSLYRLTQCWHHGRIITAIDETRKTLSEKDHQICWKGWNE